MTDAPCPLCRRAFAQHVAVRALASARWRGPSFDAAQAKSNIGLAVADALGVSPRDKTGLERLLGDVFVEAFREVRDVNPAEVFDPRAEPERWEFHVGFREAVPGDVLARVREAAVAAVARTRNFSDARLVGDETP